MMKLKIVASTLSLIVCFTACQSGGPSPKSLLDKADGDMAQMKVLGDLTTLMQGTWRSDDDPKNELRIQGDKFISIYDGKEVANDRLIWHIDCPHDCTQGMEDVTEILCFKLENEQGASCFGLLNVSDKQMEYTSMPGTGKTLNYTKTGEIPKPTPPGQQ